MKRSLLILPALLVAGAASAQDAFDYRVADMGLLQARQVQNDVGITPAEREKMNKAADAHKARLEAYQKQLQALGSMQPDRARLKGLVEQLKKEVFAILTPAQIRRTRELTLQRLGPIALTDDGVAGRVGLSPAQVGKIKTAFQAGRTKFVTLQRSTAGPILAPYEGKKAKDQAQAAAWGKEIKAKLAVASAKVKPQLDAIGKETNAGMLAVLTSAQKTKWEALKGKPFAGK